MDPNAGRGITVMAVSEGGEETICTEDQEEESKEVDESQQMIEMNLGVGLYEIQN